MNKKKIIETVLIYLAVLSLGMIILLVSKLRADQSKIEAPTAVTQAVTQAPTEMPDEEPSVAPTKEPTKEPEVSFTPAPEDGEFRRVEDKIFISVNKVNLLAEPSSESEAIAEVGMSTLLKRTGIGNEWSRVLYKSKTCYVSNQFITEEVPEAAMSGSDDPDSVDTASTSDKVVIIDPGHQGRGDSAQEPIGPNATTTKARVTSGTTGSVSGWAEYELNLAVSLQLRDELVRRGYKVHMTRETHDVSISNKERADFATANGGDILVRIHANGSDDKSVNGALCMAPTNSNQFLSASLISESQRLSQCIIDDYVAATGFGNQGVYPTDEMSGINWSTMPVTIVEMGYMSNASDDAKMADTSMQVNMVKGISDGIDSYFGGSEN